ncbi:MAG: cytochrome c biogenesis protein CcsA [Nitrospinae bacterium]|nr:cytochrome c biogenesis protein CcsA [Nitrospinota bacterium]
MTALFVLATFLYFLGMVKYLLHLGLRNRALFIMATVMIALGFAVETAGLIQRSMATGHGPYTNAFEYCLFLAWTVFAAFLVAEGYFRMAPLGAFMAPIGFFLMLISFSFSPESQSAFPVKAYWLTMHRALSFLAFGAFSLVFAAGIMYLIQERQLKNKKFGGWYHRLPALNSLDDANRIGIVFGFPVVTVGVLAAWVWADQSYGHMVINMSTILLITGWGVYGALLAGRVAMGWRGRRAALIGVAGYCVVVTSLLIHIGSR